MKLNLLCNAIGIDCPAGEEKREIDEIVTDSREACVDCLFVCIRGLHTDGHTYIADAVRAGAVCILTEVGASFEKIDGILFLEAADTRRASACLYHKWYGSPTEKLKMIGVTGTNGKTSVTHMLRAVLDASLCRCGLIGTVGCESAGRHLENKMRNSLANMTTPDPPELYRMLAEMVEDGVEFVLMEVTSHALALGKLEPITFEVGIFTNLTPEHLDFHKTMEGYADAKAELFSKSKISIINRDSPYADRMIAAARGRVVTCGIEQSGDYTAEVLENTGDGGVSYKVHSSNASIRLFCPIPGRFTVMNSMQAAIAALELGFGVSRVKDALATISGVRGRMERVSLGPGADFTVLIDYAHTPDALENLLRTAKGIKPRHGRIVLLFGCGGDRDRGKRPVMGKIASDNADFVIVTSDNSRGENPEDIIYEILGGMNKHKPYVVKADRAEAIRYAIQNAESGDVILLAGKGHEEYEISRAGRKPFCEKEIVRSAFEARRRGQNDIDGTESER